MIRKLIWGVAQRVGLVGLLSDEMFIRLQYWCWHGGALNLSEPKDFNEKIQWQKLHYRNPMMRICADKYAVRDFVKNRIGEEYLCKCLGVYEDADDIDFAEFPQKFVIKATKASSWNILCTDKAIFDQASARRTIRRWLASDFVRYGREWQYGGGPRRVVVEEFLEDPGCSDLMDYKLFTFRGETKYIWVDFHLVDSTGKKMLRRNIYDANWQIQPEKSITIRSDSSIVIPPPKCLGEMKELALKLAKDFPQCRVDFYVLEGRRIVFGELTFTSQGGCGRYEPQSFSDELGDMTVFPDD